MKETKFLVQKMDCGAEESLLRMKLAEFKEIEALRFDLNARSLWVYHYGDSAPIAAAIAQLNLDSRLLSSERSNFLPPAQKGQQKVLRIVLVINALFFALEMSGAWLFDSMGLMGDSLDMLADALVYGLSLYVVGRSALAKKRVAKTAGYLQILLALLGFGEVLRRFFAQASYPDPAAMLWISLAAFAANLYCLWLLQKQNTEEPHMKASQIFTANDLIINTGVMLAALGVWYSGSAWPDLLIGGLVFLIVMRGALRILRLG